MPESELGTEKELIDQVFADYETLKQDLPPEAGKPYLTTLRNISVALKEDFEINRDLGPRSTSLFIDKNSINNFFGLLPGLLGETKNGCVTLSISE